MTLNLDGHVSILGLTSSGKSHLAKWAARSSQRLCVTINAQAEDGWPGVETREPPTMAQVVRHGKVVWTPRSLDAIEQGLPLLVERLFAFGEITGDAAQNRAAPRVNIMVGSARSATAA